MDADVLARCEDFSPALYAWARLRIRALGASFVLAEDVVQETWLRALSARASATEVELQRSRAWVFGIAQNVLFEQVRQGARRESARSAACEASATEFLDQVEDTVTSICSRLTRDETVAHLIEFAGTLDPLDAGLLIRCGFEEQTASDVARRFGVEPDAAIKRWQRLRERLRATDFAARLGLASD